MTFHLGLKGHVDLLSYQGFKACKANHKINVSSVQGPLNWKPQFCILWEVIML